MLQPSHNSLQVHQPGRNSLGCGAATEPFSLPAFPTIAAALKGLTGWKLECSTAEIAGPLADGQAWPLADSNGRPMAHLTLHPGERRARGASTRDRHALSLAEGLSDLYRQLHQYWVTLRQREAQLATAIPVIARPEQAARLAERLQAVLRGAVEGLVADAAALYLLDDGTSELKLRSHWNLGDDRFQDPPRPLRQAVADLEALTGHVVVLETPDMMPHWNVPVECQSAVCVPVASDEVILGTLWLFSDAARDYTEAETQLLEIVSGRLATELDREVLMREVASTQADRSVARQLDQWQAERQQPALPCLDQWEFAHGATTQPGGGQCWWQLTHPTRQSEVLQTGVFTPQARSARGLLATTQLHGALCGISQQSRSPDEALATLNRITWSTSPGDDRLAMALVDIDTTSGRYRLSGTGDCHIFALRPFGWEPVPVSGPKLGADDAAQYDLHTGQIAPGDLLLMIVPGDSIDAQTARRAAERSLRHSHLSAAELVQRIAKTLDANAATILVIKRPDPSDPAST